MDVAATGLVLLAFMGSGFDDERPSPYREVVGNGMRWLASVQTEAGWFGSRYAARARFSHVVATLAVTESYESTRRPVWRDRGRRGIAAIFSKSVVRWPWERGVERADDDALVTAWTLRALSEANCEWSESVDLSIVRPMIGLLDRAAMADGGVSVDSRSSDSRRTRGGPPRGSSLTTPEFAASAALWARHRFAVMRSQEDEPIMALHQQRVAARPPALDPAKGSIDPLDWCFEFSVVPRDAADEWASDLRPLLNEMQRKTGCADLSFDPRGGLSRLGGRVIATAIAYLALEVSDQEFGTRPTWLLR